MVLTMKEKLETLLADKRQSNAQRNKDATTFSQFATSEAKEIEGRFAAHEKSSIVGSAAVVEYPAGPNWAVDRVGIEPALGVDVNAQEPVGETWEIEASLGDRALADTPSCDAVAPANVTTTETSRERTALSPLVALANPKPKRRPL
jgi:hypothetical protein